MSAKLTAYVLHSAEFRYIRILHITVCPNAMWIMSLRTCEKWRGSRLKCLFDIAVEHSWQVRSFVFEEFQTCFLSTNHSAISLHFPSQQILQTYCTILGSRGAILSYTTSEILPHEDQFLSSTMSLCSRVLVISKFISIRIFRLTI